MPDLVINTSRHQWVIPHDCSVLKLLVERRNIRANDLRFKSRQECHQFIKTLFLLSFEDEQKNQKQSPLAVLGRKLVAIQSSNTAAAYPNS